MIVIIDGLFTPLSKGDIDEAPCAGLWRYFLLLRLYRYAIRSSLLEPVLTLSPVPVDQFLPAFSFASTADGVGDADCVKLEAGEDFPHLRMVVDG